MAYGSQRPAAQRAGIYINNLDTSASSKVEKFADLAKLLGLEEMKQRQNSENSSWKN